MDGVNKLDQNTLNVMLSALQEVQNAVRAYDTKAQVVSIAFIFSLGLITTVGTLAPSQPEYSLSLVILSWLFGIIPVVTFGLVLYPSRSMAPKLGNNVSNLQKSFYVLEERYPMLEDYLESLNKSDWKIELAYEIQKNSLLRDVKRRRFILALCVAGTSYAVMFLIQLMRTINTF